jgi:hypothetical protein
MAYHIPQAARPIVEKLAVSALPVEDWVNQTGKPVPRYDQFIPPLQQVPWRPAGAPPTLSVGKMEIAEYLEIQADNDAANEALAPRWRQVKAAPTKFFKSRTGQSPADWRAARAGLDAATKFGAFDPTSNNFAFFTVGQDGKPKDAITRSEFYNACWGPLVDAYNAAMPIDAQTWSAFYENLRTDQIAIWPTTKDVRSSSFIRQFTIDVLIASLGQKNKAIHEPDPLWQRAVLIEASENRHRGNYYTVDQADQAVRNFIKAI